MGERDPSNLVEEMEARDRTGIDQRNSNGDRRKCGCVKNLSFGVTLLKTSPCYGSLLARRTLQNMDEKATYYTPSIVFRTPKPVLPIGVWAVAILKGTIIHLTKKGLNQAHIANISGQTTI